MNSKFNGLVGALASYCRLIDGADALYLLIVTYIVCCHSLCIIDTSILSKLIIINSYGCLLLFYNLSILIKVMQ